MKQIKYIFTIFISVVFVVVFASCSGGKKASGGQIHGSGNKGAFPAEFKSKDDMKKNNKDFQMKRQSRKRRSSSGEDCDCPYKKKRSDLGMSLF